jgi:hypothetical protein
MDGRFVSTEEVGVWSVDGEDRHVHGHSVLLELFCYWLVLSGMGSFMDPCPWKRYDCNRKRIPRFTPVYLLDMIICCV